MDSTKSTPKNETIEKRAKSIYDFLQSKPIFTSQNLTNWRVEFKDKCHSIDIAAYQVPISDFLVRKKLLLFSNKPYTVINQFTYNDIVEVIKAHRTYNDAFNKKNNYKKTNIRRPFPSSVGNNNIVTKNLKQIINEIGIAVIIKSLREDFGLEITANF